MGALVSILTHGPQFRLETVTLDCDGAAGLVAVTATLNVPIAPGSSPVLKQRLTTSGSTYPGTISGNSVIFRNVPATRFSDRQVTIAGLVANTSTLAPDQALIVSLQVSPTQYGVNTVDILPEEVVAAYPARWCKAFATPLAVPAGPAQDVGDMLVTCSGGSPYADKTPVDVWLFLSDDLAEGAAPVLLVGERAPYLGLAHGAPQNGGTIHRGAVQTWSRSQVLFNNVLLGPTGGADGTLLRISGLRVDASLLEGRSAITAVASLDGVVPFGTLRATLAHVLPGALPGPAGPRPFAAMVVSADHTVDAGGATDTFLVETATSPVSIHLPAAATAGNGKLYLVKRIAGGRPVVVDVAGDGPIEGAHAVSTEGAEAVQLVSDGARWWVVGGRFRIFRP